MTQVHSVVWPPLSDGPARRPGAFDIVLVHDGTPPTGEQLDRLLAALTGADAVATTDPVTDAVKQVTEGGVVAEVVDRGELARIGLPQVIRAGAWGQVEAGARVGDDTPAVVLLRSGAVVVGAPRHPS